MPLHEPKQLWSYREKVVYEIYHPLGHVVGETTDEVQAAEIIGALNKQQAVGEEPDWDISLDEPERGWTAPAFHIKEN